MTTRTIYFDESGFTGYNLLDPVQPIFSIASSDISEELAEEILRTSFPRYQGHEYHFTNIWRSNHKARLREFCWQLDQVAERSFCYVTNKRFALLAKMIDSLVEPVSTNSGYDFYDEGFCWRYTNLVYYGLTNFAPPEFLNELLNSYQEFSLAPSSGSLAVLQQRLSAMAETADERFKAFIVEMALGAQVFESYHDLQAFRSTNSLQTSTMIAVIGHWRQSYTEDFAVVHDASSSFLRDRATWETITGPDVNPVEITGGDGNGLEWPLRVISTESRDSRDSRVIQFCDVLAGLISKHFNPDLSVEDRQFMNELVTEGLGHITSNRNVPGTEFPVRIPPKRLSGPDAVDLMAEIMRGGTAS
jgi:hypothetical protein